MELTYETIYKWFDLYFEQVCKSQGHLGTVPKLKKFFAPDMELTMHTAPSQASRTMSRDALLLSFVHPGLQEDIVPRYYVIDVRQLIVAVQFEIRFHDAPSGTQWAPIQASAHYHLAATESGDLRIRKIEYWTENLPADIFEIWAQRRMEELSKYAMAYINAQSTEDT
jgi:hypothetical protein